MRTTGAGKGEMKKMTGNLLSGLIGALLVQILSMSWGVYKCRQERKALLNGLVAECDYNISIIDEILEGVIEHHGSFKRLSIEYFRTVREMSARYSFSNQLITALSRLIVDMELFNLEVDYVFNGHQATQVCAGLFGKHKVCVTKKHVIHDISGTISNARDGVLESLKELKRIAKEKRR